MTDNLGKKALKGMSWSYLSVFSMAGSQILIGAIMARLLSPADFGVVAISNLVLRFGQYFSQLGIAAAVIQKKDFSKEDEYTSHSMAILIGILVSAICFFIAPLLRGILDKPEVIPVIRVMSLTFFLTGFGIVSNGMLRKQMRFKFLAISDLISYVLAYGIGIAMAFLNYGVWALVTAMLLQRAFRSLFPFLAVRHSIIPAINKDSFKSIFSYGSRSSIVGFLEFLYGNMDTFFIGKFLGAAPLGLFNRVKTVVDLPIFYTGSNLTKVMFPLFSSINATGNMPRLRRALLESLTLLAILLFPLTVLVSSTAEHVILVLLGEQWIGALTQARLIPFASLFGLTASIFGVLFDARGLLNRKMAIMSVLLVLLTIAFMLLRPLGSLTAYTLIIVAGAFTLLFCNAYWLGKDLNITSKDYFSITKSSIILSIPIMIFGGSLTQIFLFLNISAFVSLPVTWCISFIIGLVWFSKGPFTLERKIIWERAGKALYQKLPLSLKNRFQFISNWGN